MSEFKVKIDVDENGLGVLTSTHFNIIRDRFSWKNPNINFLPKWKQKNIPKKNYAIDHNGRFQIGILDKIYDFCKEINPNLSAKDFTVTSRAKWFYEPSFPIPEHPKLFKFNGFDYTDTQIKAINVSLRRGRGIVNVATGGGKGLIMAGIIQTIRSYNSTHTFAILTPNPLTEKTFIEFKEEYGFSDDEISLWSSKREENFETPIIVFGPSLALSRQEKYFKHIATRNSLLIDECHIIKDDSKITKLVKKTKTNNIIGFTGTIPQNPQDYWSVMGVIGKVIYIKSSKELKDEGIKAKSKVNAICFNGCKMDNSKTYINEKGVTKNYTDIEMFQNEMEYHLKSPERNEYIYKWILKVCKGNTLIPIDREFHEEILQEKFKDSGRVFYVINGSTPQEERTRIYKQMENEEDAILIIKTSIIREGISIKNISYMVGYFSQKAYIRIVQLMGRIERIGGRKIPVFYDFFDTTKYSLNHFRERMDIYEKVGIPCSVLKVNLEY